MSSLSFFSEKKNETGWFSYLMKRETQAGWSYSCTGDVSVLFFSVLDRAVRILYML